MQVTNAKDHQKQTTKQASAVHQQGGKGLAMPSVPALQQDPSQQPEARTVQRKRAEEDPAQLVQKQGVVQRAVKATVPNGTRIVIENVNASDMGDTGVIIRNSQIADHKAVQFDNERDVLYRVHLNEMSPVDPGLRKQYGVGTTASVVRLSKPVTITAEIDLSDETDQKAWFFAYNGEHKIGKLIMSYEEGVGFVISDVYTNLSPDHKVPGLGVLFLNIASRIATSLNKAVMILGANRQSGEKHPAPFYAKFGFDAPDLVAIAVEASKVQKTFEQYMETYKSPITMTADTATVKDKTSRYLGL